MAIDYNQREQVYRGVTPGQFEAITEAMKLIVQEDRERGVDAGCEFVCPGCAGARTVVGAVAYDGTRLCNDCATGFELARISHTAGTCAEYLMTQEARRR